MLVTLRHVVMAFECAVLLREGCGRRRSLVHQLSPGPTSAVHVCTWHLGKHRDYFSITCGNSLRLSFYVNPPASPQTLKPSPVARHQVLQEIKMHLLVSSSMEVPHSCLQNLSWHGCHQRNFNRTVFPGRKQLCQNKGILRKLISLA